MFEVTVYKPTPEDNCTYRAEWTVPEGQEMPAGNWFAFANRAELRTGPGWKTRALQPDGYAKNPPSVVTADGYEIKIEGHKGHHWMKLVKQGETDWRVKLPLGEPLPAGKYMCKIKAKPSKFGDGDFLSGYVEPWIEMAQPGVPADGEAMKLAQVAANSLEVPVQVGLQEIPPMTNDETATEIARLRAELERARLDAAFPDKEARDQASKSQKLPF